MTALTLAIPSKGRLQEQTAAYFADCGLHLRQEGGDRGYIARFKGMPEIEVRLVSAGEIARALTLGEVHAGVVGEDGLREMDPDLERAALIKPLGFGRCDLIVAVPQSWLDVVGMEDLAEVAHLHRARTGRRLRVATKYLRLAHRFLDARGVADYLLVESLGATEGAPAAGLAEAIVDITTTGATLEANHLRILGDGVILRSEAHLAVARHAAWDAQARAAMEGLLDIVEARARAKEWKLLRLAPGRDGAEAMAARAAGLGCKLASTVEGAPMLELYCPTAQVAAVCAALQRLFGGAIGVQDAQFIFESPNPLRTQLSTALSR